MKIYAKRCKIDIVKTACVDGRYIHQSEEIAPASFDRVLIDAPCSGLGVMGRKPDIRLKSPRIEEITQIQQDLIKAGAEMVKAGGRLIYSTCTISRAENGEIVENLLKERHDFKLKFEKQLIPGIDGSGGFYVAILEGFEV